MKAMRMRFKYFVPVVACLLIISGCGQNSSSKSDEPLNWDTPAAFDFKALNALIPSESILTGYSEFSRFTSIEPEIEPVSGITDTNDGSLTTSPATCRESDAFLTQRTFAKTAVSNASNNMLGGLSWYWSSDDPKDYAKLIVTIVGDSNVSEAFLLKDMATELKSCATVTNETSDLTWVTNQTFTEPSTGALRIDFGMTFSGSFTGGRKGLVIARQVGRNLVYVEYLRDGQGAPSDYPISTAIEGQLNLLLDAVAQKLNS
jgi:hypothetical protein